MMIVISKEKIRKGDIGICVSPISDGAYFYNLPLNSKHIIEKVSIYRNIPMSIDLRDATVEGYNPNRFIYLRELPLLKIL